MPDYGPRLTGEEYLLLDELISQRFGIHFPDHKREILASRLRPRLEAHRLRSYFDYYLLLQCDRNGEVDQLARQVSNNETYFFRETYQFEALFGDPELCQAQATPGTLRILSAGCSSGEEPYTLNIFARRHGLQLGGAKVVIDAFDIDRDRLATARKAAYGAYSLRAVSEAQQTRYFSSKSHRRFELRSPYTEGVVFSHGNIVDLASFRSPYAYDVVFCRNVLIYFSEAALHRAIDNFARVLRPGGILFLGHSESILGLDKPFETLRLDHCLAYRRTG